MNVPSPQQLRLLPAVERVLNLPPIVSLCAEHGRGTVTGWVRQTLHDFRCGAAGALSSIATEIEARVVQMVTELAEASTLQRLRKVINGTGVILHTNLGRAPLAPAAIEAMIEAAAATNLEVDLTTGRRGRRAAAVETLCREVTGAEAALVVNNCAAATLLTLQTIAAGRRVIISRGQLIEIGGSFRLPDVFQQAGVTLHEVGTTNRTRLADYAQAIGPDTAALLRVHPSNYRISGFCESVAINELAVLGKKHQLPAIDDVGSGCLYDLSGYGLPDEPIVRESLQAGADLVLFSGDKLLGGPQCGVIVGRADLVARLRSNPLARALRVDKVTLAALQATLEIHRAGRAFRDVPVLRQLSLSADELHTRGTQLLAQLQAATSAPEVFSLQSVMSAPGGGTLPDQTLPSWAVAVNSANANELSQRLRLGTPAVFARVQEGLTLIDLRTVNPDDDATLVRCLTESISG